MPHPRSAATSDPPLRLPEDGPLDEQGRLQHDEYRLDPVIDALHRQLADWLDTPAKQRATIPPRIGLFGSLGQGKSTVLRCVVDRLQQHRSLGQRWGEVAFGPRVARFDVSFFKADDLEWRFFTAVLWRRVLRNCFVAVFMSTVFLISLASIGVTLGWWDLSACGSNVQGCWVWIVAAWAALSALAIPFLAGLKGVCKSATGLYKGINPANGLYLARRDQLIQTIARFLPALPDVVVVDDLDRAGVEQQRGFLRALSRFSQELGFAVVVCMDESEILAAKPDPEAPEELLRKTITVELRVPERTREDVAMLAAVCAREFAKKNRDSHERLARTLTSVQFLADLMRTLLLGATDTPAHPRKVWRLLTGVAQQARQLGVTGVGDLGALMRIEGLYQLAPPLRRYPDKLREALETNRLEQFEPLLNGLGLDQRRLGIVRDFFLRTRMMQPTIQDGWFRLLGGFSDPGILERGSPEFWHADWTMGQRSVNFFRLFVEAIELDASGYAHDLRLDWFEPISGPEPNQSEPPPGYRFFIPGGYLEEFTDKDLPKAFCRRDSEYLAQC